MYESTRQALLGGQWAVGLPAAGGFVGVSRAAGQFEEFTTGRRTTPVLKIPFDEPVFKPRRAPSIAGPAGGSPSIGHAEDDECEEGLSLT